MQTIDPAEFEKMVAAGIAAIPERFLQRLDNVAIVVEDAPTTAQLQKLKIRRGWSLFGLYEGVPQAVRGGHYSLVVPDKITIFRRPIEAAATNAEGIKEIVTTTVWHEIAHHFGLDEGEVRRAEIRKKS